MNDSSKSLSEKKIRSITVTAKFDNPFVGMKSAVSVMVFCCDGDLAWIVS